MKRIIISILLVVCSVSFGNNVFSQVSVSDFKKLDWLAGTWAKTHNKDGESGQEKWVKLSESEWQGSGITLKGTDTAFVEKLKMVVNGKYIYYVADIPGNPEPVWFRFTEISGEGFVCENPEYDFPKKIEYRKTGNKIKATISGDGKFVDYFFKKQKK